MEVSSDRCTVVFDIDDTLCKFFKNNDETDQFALKHPELLAFKFGDHTYFMYPHFKSLLEYLLNHDCYIDFFSAGSEARNISLMTDYLSDVRMFGSTRFLELKNLGQFRVFSRHHMVDDKKPVKQLLRPGQTMDDILLVDDSQCKAASGEHPLVEVPRVYDYLNTMYYLLGLFSAYFGTVPAERPPFRQWYELLKKCPGSWILTNKAQLSDIGLREVQKWVPEARFDCSMTSELPIVEPTDEQQKPNLRGQTQEPIRELQQVEVQNGEQDRQEARTEAVKPVEGVQQENEMTEDEDQLQKRLDTILLCVLELAKMMDANEARYQEQEKQQAVLDKARDAEIQDLRAELKKLRMSVSSCTTCSCSVPSSLPTATAIYTIPVDANSQANADEWDLGDAQREYAIVKRLTDYEFSMRTGITDPVLLGMNRRLIRLRAKNRVEDAREQSLEIEEYERDQQQVETENEIDLSPAPVAVRVIDPTVSKQVSADGDIDSDCIESASKQQTVLPTKKLTVLSAYQRRTRQIELSKDLMKRYPFDERRYDSTIMNELNLARRDQMFVFKNTPDYPIERHIEIWMTLGSQSNAHPMDLCRILLGPTAVASKAVRDIMVEWMTAPDAVDEVAFQLVDRHDIEKCWNKLAAIIEWLCRQFRVLKVENAILSEMSALRLNKPTAKGLKRLWEKMRPLYHSLPSDLKYECDLYVIMSEVIRLSNWVPNALVSYDQFQRVYADIIDADRDLLVDEAIAATVKKFADKELRNKLREMLLGPSPKTQTTRIEENEWTDDCGDNESFNDHCCDAEEMEEPEEDNDVPHERVNDSYHDQDQEPKHRHHYCSTAHKNEYKSIQRQCAQYCNFCGFEWTATERHVGRMCPWRLPSQYRLLHLNKMAAELSLMEGLELVDQCALNGFLSTKSASVAALVKRKLTRMFNKYPSMY